jgi:hypothetical protein
MTEYAAGSLLSPLSDFYPHYHHHFFHANWGEPPDKESDWWIVKLTVALVLVGIAQCILFYYQWRKMRETVEDARASTKRGLRAYVTIINPDYGAKGETELDLLPIAFVIFIKNGGQTPAYKVVVNSEWKVFEGAELHWPEDLPFTVEKVTRERREGAVVLGSGEIEKSICDLLPHADGNIFQAAYERFKKAEVTLFIYGEVTYLDTYGDPQYTKFCRVFRPDPGTPGVVLKYDQNVEAT